MIKQLIRSWLVSQIQRRQCLADKLSNLLRDAGVQESSDQTSIEAGDIENGFQEPTPASSESQTTVEVSSSTSYTLPEADIDPDQTAVEVSPSTIYTLDYPLNLRPRYEEEDRRSYPLIYDRLNSRRESYYKLLSSLVRFKKDFLRIPKDHPENESPQPFWHNDFFTRLDAMALYGFLATHNSKRYLEIGSGYSTRFARRAIRNHQLQTRITCLDPNPRTDIDAIADVRIRTPLEECDLSLFDELEECDILFMDGSHRAFVNSDATVFFMEVLPALKSGVLVQIHDIKLPYDYPTEWMERLYNEQYLLGAYLLAETKIFEVLLPNALISHDDQLRSALDALYEHPYMHDIPPVGASFWIRKL